jgi:myo-inositol-1-phosphate synthase
MQEFPTAASLLSAIEANHPEVSPSLLYAVAAVLEGCSFVNGGSQNTLCPGLEELAHTHAHAQTPTQTPTHTNKCCYVLGTDFKAGQTKFKTAAVEYLRALGLKPTVIASSNHLGNNDMLNLTSKKTLDAKMRVKNDIFTGWEEEIDHQVRVMYTPYIGDEKRDIVEYTSLGFLGSPHTMLTYTRCMDSILCVPLMIDAAVWCDYFARHHVAPAQVVLATAYLFKVPEGGAKGCDPGFFHQVHTHTHLHT